MEIGAMKLTHTLAGLSLALALAAPVVAQDLTMENRRDVVLGVATLIEDRYVHADRGAVIADALRAGSNDFSHTDPAAFADALTYRLRDLSQDGHFAVEHRPSATDEGASATEAAHMETQLERWYGVGVNHGFESVQRLEDGIGYLDLRVFAPPEMGADLMQGAMSLLAQSPALIIDLRHNGGGMDEMVLLLQAYLLDESVEVSGRYDRPSDRHTRAFTPSWVPGRRFGGEKPVFILISRRTFSAAEAFAYDMQAMGRATVVGQTSGGGAHPFNYRSVTPEFVLSLPEGRSINPITGGDWQGVGVRPDVETEPDEALDAALNLARETLSASSR
jgi:hypothetical protein